MCPREDPNSTPLAIVDSEDGGDDGDGDDEGGGCVMERVKTVVVAAATTGDDEPMTETADGKGNDSDVVPMTETSLSTAWIAPEEAASKRVFVRLFLNIVQLGVLICSSLAFLKFN